METGAHRYMHARNVLHRDLKPENVLVCGAHEDRVKLVDFGLSKLVGGSQGLSRAHTMVGTPSYLAPEIENLKRRTPSLDLDALDEQSGQLDLSDGDATYDDRVDAWSLGVTLYVMLVARFPVYDRDGDGKIVAARLPPELSEGARRLLGTLLAADPADRATVAAARRDAWCAPENALALTPPTTPPKNDRPTSPEITDATRSMSLGDDETSPPRDALMGLAGAHAGARGGNQSS